MEITFKTTSLRLFNKLRQYIFCSRVHASVSCENEQYLISVFGLSNDEANKFISKMTGRLHLKPKREHAA